MNIYRFFCLVALCACFPFEANAQVTDAATYVEVTGTASSSDMAQSIPGAALHDLALINAHDQAEAACLEQGLQLCYFTITDRYSVTADWGKETVTIETQQSGKCC